MNKRMNIGLNTINKFSFKQISAKYLFIRRENKKGRKGGRKAGHSNLSFIR